MTHMALWISQAQFFMSLSFMLLFLLLEIGLAWMLAFFKLRAQVGGEHWTVAYRFWVRIFALSFVAAFGSAVPVMIQFGGLWPALMERIGDIAGPLLAAAVLTIFVFKTCFVGAMLFGQRYMSQRVHGLLVVMVALGLTAAAIWPVALFSWLRTPSGAFFSDGRYVVIDWSDVVFNPSFFWYAGLLLLLALVTTSVFILGVTALQSLRRPANDSDRAVFGVAVRVGAVSLILLAVTAVFAGRAMAIHEPARAAVALGYWQSGTEPSLAIVALPDAQRQDDRWAWRLENRGGAFLAQDSQGKYRGFDQFSGMAPPVAVTFWSLRVAVLGTVLMLLVVGVAWWRLRAHAGDPGALSPRLRKLLVVTGFGGWLVTVSGFAHIVIGAYPYAVAGTVTLSEVLTEASLGALTAGGVALLLVYGFCMAGFLQLLWHAVRYGVVPVARRRGRA